MDSATAKIRAALKTIQAASDRGTRLSGAKKVLRLVWELRQALREVSSLKTLRENAAQAQAWDAIEAVLSHRQLVVSEALRGALCETVVVLYAAGDAGGQLYAAARGLHELCGEEKRSVVRSSSNQRSVGSRAASFECLGALCAAYAARLGSNTLTEARARLGKPAQKASEGPLRASALAALAEVVLVSPAESLVFVAGKKAPMHGTEIIKMVASRAAAEKSPEARFALGKVAVHLAQATARATTQAVHALAAAAADDAAKKRTDKQEEKKQDQGDKDDDKEGGKGASSGKDAPKKSPAKPQITASAKAKADYESATSLLDLIFDVSSKWLGDEAVDARVEYAKACGFALSARIDAARATRERLSANQARADDADKNNEDEASGKRKWSMATDKKKTALSNLGGGATGPTLVSGLRWAASAMAKASNRLVLSGASACAATILRLQSDFVFVDEASVNASISALVSDEAVASEPSRCAVAQALRGGLILGSSERRHRDLLTSLAKFPGRGGALEVCLATACAVVRALGAAVPANEANAFEKRVVERDARSSNPGVRARAAELAEALASTHEDRRARLARGALRDAMIAHHALVETVDEGKDKASAARDALDGLATVTASLLYSAGPKQCHLPWSLQDEALAVGESLVTRQFDASLFRNGTAALICCVRSGWAILGALASDVGFVARRKTRIVHALDRGLNFDQDDDDKLDANHQLACLEAALGAVAKLQKAAHYLRCDIDIVQFLGRVVETAVQVGRNATTRLYRLVAAATLEVYASLHAKELEAAVDKNLSQAFRWALTLFKEAAAPLEGGEGNDSPGGDAPSANDDDNDDLATTTLALDSLGEVSDVLSLAHAADGRGAGDDIQAAALAALRAGASDMTAAAIGIAYLTPTTVVSTPGASLEEAQPQKGLGVGHSLPEWLRSRESCALAYATTATSRQQQQKMTAHLVTTRLVDAIIRSLSTLSPHRSPDTQCQALELVAATLVAALQAPTKATKGARLDRRQSVATVNAAAALLAMIASLKKWSSSHFTDSPRDALARGLASASPRARRFSATAIAILVSKLPDDEQRTSSVRALADAASRTDAPKSALEGARRTGAAIAVATLAAHNVLPFARALDALRKPLVDATASALGPALPRAWALVALARVVKAWAPRQTRSDSAAGPRRQLVDACLNVLETQLVSPRDTDLRAGADAVDESPDLKRGTSATGPSMLTSTAALSTQWTNGFGVDESSVLCCAAAQCLASLGPLIKRLRQCGPDAPLVARYSALLDVILARRDYRAWDAAALAAAAASGYASLAKSLVAPVQPVVAVVDAFANPADAQDTNDDEQDRFALMRGQALAACLGFLTSSKESFLESAAAVRCLRAIAKAVTAGTPVGDLARRAAKLVALEVLDLAVAGRADHALCCCDKTRIDAEDALGAASRTLGALVDDDLKGEVDEARSRRCVSWLLLAAGLHAHQGGGQARHDHVLLGGRLFQRRDGAQMPIVEALADEIFPVELFANDDIDDGLARGEATATAEDVADDDDEPQRGGSFLGTRAAVLEASRSDALVGLGAALDAQPHWQTKATALKCATTVIRSLLATPEAFDVAKARLAVDDVVTKQRAAQQASARAVVPPKKKKAFMAREAEARWRERRVLPDCVALRVDLVVGLGCAMAAATVGDDAPLPALRCLGLELITLVADGFAATPDPDSEGVAAPVLAQYTSQVASSLRATLGPASSLDVMRRARDALVAVARASLLDDPVQIRRLIKLHLSATPVLTEDDAGTAPTKARLRPDRDEERFPPHVPVLDYLERLALIAQLELLACDWAPPPAPPVPSLLSGDGDEPDAEDSVFGPWLVDVSLVAEVLPKIERRPLTDAARRAIASALKDSPGHSTVWPAKWAEACLDAARLLQGSPGWPAMIRPRVSVGRLYDTSVDNAPLKAPLLSFAPLFAAAAASSPATAGSLLAAASCAVATDDSRQLLWLAAMDRLLPSADEAGAAAVDALAALVTAEQRKPDGDTSLVAATLRAASRRPKDAAPCVARALAYSLDYQHALLPVCLSAAARVAPYAPPAAAEDLVALGLKVARRPPPDDDAVAAAKAPRRILAASLAALVKQAPPQDRLIRALPTAALKRAEDYLAKHDARVAATAAAAVLDAWIAAVQHAPNDGVLAAAAGPLCRLALLDNDGVFYAAIISPLVPPRVARSGLPAALTNTLAAVLMPAVVVVAKRHKHSDAALSLLAACAMAPREDQRATLLATVLQDPLGPMLASDATLGDALVKLVKVNQALFRSAIVELDDDAKTAVQNAMRTAMARQQAAASSSRQSTAAGPSRRSSLKIDMSRYNG